MSRWAGSILGSLEPSPDEVDRVKSGFDAELLQHLTDATSPSDDEVRHLLASRAAWAQSRARRRRVWVAGALVPVGGLAMVVAALMVWVMLPASYGPVPVTLGTPQQLASSAPLELGPSIDVLGEGTLVVQQASTSGTELELVSGRGLFEVDPEGDYRHLVIHAGDVDVEVKGTRFEVIRGSDGVEVAVIRGLVEVRHDGESMLLVAGERWSETAVAMVDLPDDEDQDTVDEVVVETPSVDEAPPIDRPIATDTTTPTPEEADAEVDDSTDAHTETLAALQARMGSSEPPTVKEIDALLRAAGPSHAIWHDAGVLRLQVRTLDDPLGAIVEMGSWLDLYSDSPRRVEVLWMHATEARTRLGACDRGLASYVELTKRLEGPEVAEPAAYRGICAARAGNSEVAAEWLDVASGHPLPARLATEVQSARESLQ